MLLRTFKSVEIIARNLHVKIEGKEPSRKGEGFRVKKVEKVVKGQKVERSRRITIFKSTKLIKDTLKEQYSSRENIQSLKSIKSLETAGTSTELSSTQLPTATWCKPQETLSFHERKLLNIAQLSSQKMLDLISVRSYRQKLMGSRKQLKQL